MVLTFRNQRMVNLVFLGPLNYEVQSLFIANRTYSYMLVNIHLKSVYFANSSRFGEYKE